MKNAFAKATVLMATGFAAFLGATPAKCETPMRVNIPFAFVAGEQTHAAGAYEVRVNHGLRYVELRPLDSALVERVLLDGAFSPRADKNATGGFLQFRQYGNSYALRSVGAPGAAEGLDVKRSKAEKELSNVAGGSSGKVVTIR
jgi:hypothetical protein